MIHRKPINAYWVLAGILIITYLVYLPSLNNGFTNWDDLEQVLENKDVHSLSFANTSKIFSSTYIGMYQPFTTQVYSFIYAIFGPAARAFHATALFLHLVNVLLVFFLIRSFSRKDAPALITAALFALNPLQTESVSWISAMSNLLYTSFFLAGLITYLRFIRKRHKMNYFLTLLLFILSLLSKSAAVTFPVVLILADFFFRRKFNVKLILEKIPFLFLSFLVGMVIIYAREEAGHIINIAERYSELERLLLIVYALAFYIARLFVPTGLSAFHPYPETGHLPLEFFIAPLIPLMFMFLLFRLRGETRRQVMAGFVFFFITIAVVLEIIPVGAQVVKERYVYLPSSGLYYGFAVLLLFFTEIKRKRVWLPATIMIISMLIFGTMTFSRSKTWHDSFSLWDDVLEQYPHASAALINRGNAWQEKENYIRAISDYSLAIQYEPTAADAYLDRGLAYYKMEKAGEALKDFDRAILMGIDDAEAYNSRGLLKASLNRIDGALSDFREATSIDPNYVDAWINQGLMHASREEFNLALSAFSSALGADSGSAKAFYWRGMVYLRMGITTEACRDLNFARSLGWQTAQWPEICNQ